MPKKKKSKENHVDIIVSYILHDVYNKECEIKWLLNNIPVGLFNSNYKDIYEERLDK